MPVLPLALGWIVLAAEPTPPAPAGYLPTGSAVELFDTGRLALLRDPRVKLVSFRSPNRSEGASPAPRAAGGGTTLAQVDGPGIIQRLWFTPPADVRPGRSSENVGRLRIFLDRQPLPALDISLDDLFAGNHPHFPRPIVGAWAGGFVCYVPIAFRGGCRVEVEGREGWASEVDVLTLPRADGISTFTETPPEADAAALKLARALWLEPEALWSKDPSDSRKVEWKFTRNAEWKALSLRPAAEEAEYAVDAGKRSTHLFVLPAGPRTVRGLEVVPTPKTAEAWRSARLRLVWDGDDLADAGVDLPLGLAFGKARRAPEFRSLLVGQDAMIWYSYFPMPYRRQALLQIDADEPVKGVVRVRTLPGVDPASGYFRAHYRESSPSTPGAAFEWLGERGRGHLAGIFLDAEGPGEALRGPGCASRLAVDGRPAPLGEGLGRWFNGAWPGGNGGLDPPQVFPLSGLPVARREGATIRAAAYRWHLTDPVPFARSVSAEIGYSRGHTCAAEYRAAVFWYSERPGPARAGR